MKKKKSAEGKDGGVEPLPIPIQTFLWRQSSPFVRQKLGKQCEASCVSFERVIVQNILHGLSPSLCEAIQATSRWRLVQASLSHVIHCCAQVLENRQKESVGLESPPKFSSNEIKLFYTLHWVLLDAASECEDADLETGRSSGSYLHTLDSIQLFVYMIIPLINILKPQDFDSLKLENGRRLWDSLWNYRPPFVTSFSTPVKVRRVLLKDDRRARRTNVTTGDIYVGKQDNTGDIYLGDDEPNVKDTGTEAVLVDIEGQRVILRETKEGTAVAPLARMSDVCNLSTQEIMTSQKSVDQGVVCPICAEAPPSCLCGGAQACSTEKPSKPVDQGELCPICFDSANSCTCGGAKAVSTEKRVKPVDQGELCPICYDTASSCMCGGAQACSTERRHSVQAALGVLPVTSKTLTDPLGSQRLHEVLSTVLGRGSTESCLDATFLDVAVLKCLFTSTWRREGVYWSLRYLHLRLLEITAELEGSEGHRRERSQSLPTPDPITTLTSLTTGACEPATPVSPRKDSAAIERLCMEEMQSLGRRLEGMKGDEEGRDVVQSLPRNGEGGTKVEPTFKKIKVFSDRFKSLRGGGGQASRGDNVAGRLSRSTRSSPERDSTPSERERLLSNRDLTPTLKMRGSRGRDQGVMDSDEDDSGGDGALCDESDSLLMDASRRKSMPSFRQRQQDEANNQAEMSSLKIAQEDDLTGSRESMIRGNKSELTLCKPIITITTDSPDPQARDERRGWGGGVRGVARELVNKSKNNGGSNAVSRARRESLSSVKSRHSHDAMLQDSWGVMPRSQTDSTINYTTDEELEEAPGSLYYIQPNGHLNYHVIVSALQNVSGRYTDAEVNSAILSVISCLLDLGVFSPSRGGGDGREGRRRRYRPAGGDWGEGKREENNNKNYQKQSEADGTKKAFNIALDCVFRVYRTLGCPHGCTEGGIHGQQGAELRQEGLACLTRLMDVNPRLFRRFLHSSFLSPTLQEIVDCLHSLLGFCADPSSLTAHLGAKKLSFSEPGSFGGMGHRTGYATNFGEPLPGISPVLTEIISNTLKLMLSKFVDNKREILSQENISLYCDVCQMLTYIKETHGSTFRRIALSGLLDAFRSCHNLSTANDQFFNQSKQTTGKQIRRTQSVASDSGDEREVQGRMSVADRSTSKVKAGQGRKSLFRRKTKKQSLVAGRGAGGALSDSDALDSEVIGGLYGRLSPRVSMCVLNEDQGSHRPGSNKAKRKTSKFNIAWRRSIKSDYDDDSSSDILSSLRGGGDTLSHGGPGSGAATPSSGGTPTRQKPMSFKAAGQATLTFLSARRRIEDGLKNFSKKRQSKRESLNEEMMQGSYGRDRDAPPGSGFGGSARDSTAALLRERKLINSFAVKSGLLRFNFMLDCCNPGTLPDANLVAALLDLEAPIVARAALLLECAHFVNRCNKGDWPPWMKMNLTGFYPSGGGRPQASAYHRNLMLQRNTGKLFHQWAEAIGNHLSDIMLEEATDAYSVIDPIKEESRKRDLRIQDEEEDFLDESKVNRTGSDCPYSLKLVACQLMLEITTFLRETFQHLPKSKLIPRESTWGERPGLDVGGCRGSLGGTRRWSMALGSPGVPSERSNSRSSQGDSAGPNPQQSEGVTPSDSRKISFAVLADRSDSLHSSTASLADTGTDNKGRRVTITTSMTGTPGSVPGQGQKLLKARRGSGHNISFKQNRSFKMKRTEEEGSIKRRGSGQGQGQAQGQVQGRKVSTQSLQSSTSVEDAAQFQALSRDSVAGSSASGAEGGTGGPAEGGGLGGDTWGIYTGDELQDMGDSIDAGDELMDYSRSMPWLKVVIQLANASNFICDHQPCCHINCYERQRRSCARLVAALQKIYVSSKAQQQQEEAAVAAAARSRQTKEGGHSGSGGTTAKDRLKRRTSSSPMSRRDSTPLLDKVKVDTNLVNKARIAIALEKEAAEMKKKLMKQTKEEEDLPVLNYLEKQVLSLTHAPLALITKAAPILSEDAYTDMMPVAWELLIESDQELAAAAVMIPDQIRSLITKQLTHHHVSHRISAIQRFSVLWRFRYQVWPRMEDGAHMYFKVPPPSIDFVLPSPTIGLPNLPLVDPPWMPHFKTKVEEVTLNQNETKSFVTATTTRRKQQQEMVHRALLAEEDRRRAARENFHMTSVPVRLHAAIEPALAHASEDHDDVLPEEISLTVASRRMSVAPVNRAAAAAAAAAAANARNMSGRHSSMFYGRSAVSMEVGEEEKVSHFHTTSTHHYQPAQQFFPSCICNAALPIIRLLDDLEVSPDGISVSEVASKVVWDCLVEDPTLFLRTFLEKLTVRSRQQELIYLLRKLLFRFPSLPAQTGHCLFNYLVVPSVNGIYFKDLKQTLRKEQCDPHVMIAANIPSAKKLIVHGPDLSSIPSQFPIHEDTQFLNILHESLDFFNIPDDEHCCHFIMDTKTNQIHNSSSYVRDFYFFRRNHYPQLSLVKLDQKTAEMALQKQAFILKFVEMEKVLFSLSVVDSASGSQVQSHVSFLHEELLKLPSFPRKALESEFELYGGSLGKEIAGLDTLHKYVWTKIFKGMSSTVTHVGDLPLFLNVINGTLYLHPDNSALLSQCLATFINASMHFKQVFSTSGFGFIMPTLVRVYSTNEGNPVICRAIQFTCRQFFLLHRNPFLLQMFGSIAPILRTAEDSKTDRKIDPESLYDLLCSLDKDIEDEIHIMDNVDGPKPLTALDFCYRDDADRVSMLDVINLCITVIAYACESHRAVQMLMILEAVLPFYLTSLSDKTKEADSSQSAKEELAAISSLTVSIKAMLISCEQLAKNFTGGTQWQFDAGAEAGGKNKLQQNHSNHSPQAAVIYNDEQSDIRFRNMEEGFAVGRSEPDDEESFAAQRQFLRPRNSIVSITAQFYSHCSARLKLLRTLLHEGAPIRHDLLDHKSQNRLADIAHTLLKIAPYDMMTMKSEGLKRYMLDIIPKTDWSQSAVRPALNLILRRLERLFNKIHKSAGLRRHLDWNAATNFVEGIRESLVNCPYIAHLPYLKALISMCLSMITADESGTTSTSSSIHSVAYNKPEPWNVRTYAPQVFSQAVIRLVALQFNILGDQYTLEQSCNSLSSFPSPEKTANMLLNYVLPLCAHMGQCRDKNEGTQMRQGDIAYALTMVLQALLPSPRHAQGGGRSGGGGAGSRLHHLSVGDIGRSGSVMSHHGSRKSTSVSSCGSAVDYLQNIAFLGLKIVMLSFEEQLSSEWFRISKCVTDLITRLQGGFHLWKFIDFVVSIRTPVYLLLRPVIKFKMMKLTCETEVEYFLQQTVHHKLHNSAVPESKSRGEVMQELLHEVKQILDDTSFCSSDIKHSVAAMLSSPVHSHFSNQSSQDLTSPTAWATSEDHRASSSLGKDVTATDRLQEKVTRIGSEAEGSEDKTLSRRILATEGSSILDKFTARREASTEEEPNVSKIRRRRRKLTRLKITCEPENEVAQKWEDCLNENGSHSADSIDACQSNTSSFKVSPALAILQRSDGLQRHSPVIFRGVLRNLKPSLKPTLAADISSSLPDSSSFPCEPNVVVVIPEDVQATCNGPPVEISDKEESLSDRLKRVSFLTKKDEYHRKRLSNSESSIVVGGGGGGGYAGRRRSMVRSMAEDHNSVSPLMDPPARGAQEELSGAAAEEAKLHRLQRQDAKSRKTFKIKRNQATIKGQILRSATVKGHVWGRTSNQGDVPSTVPSFTEESGGESSMEASEHMEPLLEESRDESEVKRSDEGSEVKVIEGARSRMGRLYRRMEGSLKDVKKGRVGESAVAQRRNTGDTGAGRMWRGGLKGEEKSQSDRTIDEMKEEQSVQATQATSDLQSCRAKKFLQKSKSHDDSGPLVEPAPTGGTARARIARHGAKLLHGGGTHSPPTTSPTRLEFIPRHPSGKEEGVPEGTPGSSHPIPGYALVHGQGHAQTGHSTLAGLGHPHAGLGHVQAGSGHPQAGLGHAQAGLSHPQAGLSHPQAGLGHPQAGLPPAGHAAAGQAQAQVAAGTAPRVSGPLGRAEPPAAVEGGQQQQEPQVTVRLQKTTETLYGGKGDKDVQLKDTKV